MTDSGPGRLQRRRQSDNTAISREVPRLYWWEWGYSDDVDNVDDGDNDDDDDDDDDNDGDDDGDDNNNIINDYIIYNKNDDNDDDAIPFQIIQNILFFNQFFWHSRMNPSSGPCSQLCTLLTLTQIPVGVGV